MNYTIRPARLEDAPGIQEVARHTWHATYAQSVAVHNRQQLVDRTYSPRAVREAISDAHGWFYVALHGERVVGFAQFLRRIDGQGELVRIYVHPDHQRRGMGRALLATGLPELAAAGMADCYVSAEVNNTAARTFYERFGFQLQREYGQFLGDQLIRLVEYAGSIAGLLGTKEQR